MELSALPITPQNTKRKGRHHHRRSSSSTQFQFTFSPTAVLRNKNHETSPYSKRHFLGTVLFFVAAVGCVLVTLSSSPQYPPEDRTRTHREQQQYEQQQEDKLSLLFMGTANAQTTTATAPHSNKAFSSSFPTTAIISIFDLGSTNNVETTPTSISDDPRRPPILRKVRTVMKNHPFVTSIVLVNLVSMIGLLPFGTAAVSGFFPGLAVALSTKARPLLTALQQATHGVKFSKLAKVVTKTYKICTRVYEAVPHNNNKKERRRKA